MMKRLVLLLLLTSWSHLGSEARNCDTSISMPSFILHLDGSEKAKADVSFTHGYSIDNLTTCLEDCCSATYGPCSVATYKNQSVEKNCLHFYCWPLTRCKFLPTTFGDTYTFPGAKLGHHALDNIIATQSDERAKSHARSVAARKGAENIAVSRKGVSVEHVFPNSPLNDNPSESLDTELPILQDDDEDFANTTTTMSSKIKARKGVESLTESIIAPTATATQEDMPSSIINFLNSSSDSNVTTSDLISLIEHVFQEELNNSNIEYEVPYNLTLPYHVDNTSASTVILPNSSSVSAIERHGLSPSFSIEPSSELYSFSIPQTITPTSTLKANDMLSTAQLLDPSTSSIDIEQTSTSQSTNNLRPSVTTIGPIISTSTNTYLKEVTHETVSFTTTTTTSSTSSTKDLKNRLESVVRETESERRYKSSMHLVLSLVIGLLVLLTVMGVIAKRVYDLWIRRHYSRMDFLIDGLYDGY